MSTNLIQCVVDVVGYYVNRVENPLSFSTRFVEVFSRTWSRRDGGFSFSLFVFSLFVVTQCWVPTMSIKLIHSRFVYRLFFSASLSFGLSFVCSPIKCIASILFSIFFLSLLLFSLRFLSILFQFDRLSRHWWTVTNLRLLLSEQNWRIIK